MGLHSISVTRLFAEICGSQKTKRNMTNNDRNEIPNLYRPDRTPAISWLPLSVYGPISRHGATPQPDSPQPPSHAGKVLLIVDQRFQLHCCPLCIKRLHFRCGIFSRGEEAFEIPSFTILSYIAVIGSFIASILNLNYLHPSCTMC